MEEVLLDIFGIDISEKIITLLARMHMEKMKEVHEELLTKEHVMFTVMGILSPRSGIELLDYSGHFKKFRPLRTIHSGDIYGCRHSNNKPHLDAPVGVPELGHYYPGVHNKTYMTFPHLYNTFGAKLEDFSLLTKRTNSRGYHFASELQSVSGKLMGNNYLRDALIQNGVKVRKQETRARLVNLLMKLE